MTRETWSCRTGFILATIGSAVGLGNIWRFNYLTYENGGGAFLIPYFAALFSAGISLIILELALGSRFKGAAPIALKRAGKRFEWIGWWAALTGFIITMYYVVIVGWALIYLEKAFSLRWGDDANGYFFGTVLQTTGSAWDLGGFPIPVLAATAVVWATTWLVESRVVEGSPGGDREGQQDIHAPSLGPGCGSGGESPDPGGGTHRGRLVPEARLR